MSDDGDRVEGKLDRLMEHVLEIKTTLARLEGADLPERVEKLEAAVHENDRRWSKLAGISAVAGTLGGGLIGAFAKKLGLTP